MNWKDLLHYGSAAGLVLLGLIGMAFPSIPGIHIDPTVCFATAVGIFSAGLKGGWSSGSTARLLMVMAIGAAIFALLLPGGGDGAWAATPTPTPRPKLTTAQAQANPLAVLDQFAINDLEAALADAQAAGDKVSAPCWQALLTAAQSRQGATVGLPSGIFSGIQKARDLKMAAANALSPSGTLASINQACAAVVLDAQNTLLMLGIGTGIVVGSGGVALPALPGILPMLLSLPK